MDLRLAAIVFVLAGIVLGGVVPISALGYITAFVVGFIVIFLWRTNHDAPGGTSGAMGLTFMVLGGAVCLMVPAWLVQLLK